MAYSTLDDLTLIEEVKKTNDNNSFVELVSRHTGIYNMIAWRYLHTGNRTDYLDLIDNMEYNFYSFINDYNPEKGTKFSTFIGERTKYLCLTINKGLKFNNNALNIEEFLDDHQPDSDLMEKDNNTVLLDTINNFPHKTFRDIMLLRLFSSDNTWREIAKKVGVTTQYVHKTYMDHIEELKTAFSKNLNKIIDND